MEGRYILKKNVIAIAHLPTAILVVGYVVFWMEMYIFKVSGGVTTPLAWILWLIFCCYVFVRNRRGVIGYAQEMTAYWRQQNIYIKTYLVVGMVVSSFILLCALKASLLPPHLIQEFDVLNYHLTLPRQHLILHSFRHIPWSSADLFFFPVQFALAPYWLATELPNKLPQFFFLLGLIFVSCRLAGYFGARKFAGVALLAFAVIGTHSIGIQMGTAMLDLVICYCFLAFIDSFLRGNYILAAIEFSFFFWSKPFVPFQVVIIGLVMFFLFVIFKSIKGRTACWGFSQEINDADVRKYGFGSKRILYSVIILSVFLAGPFLAKSLYYSGTPFYPFGSGLVQIRNDGNAAASLENLRKASEAHMSSKDDYGHGRSFKNFIQHFWLIAVPDKDVNNKFDYPVGLPYLLFVGPFLYFFYYSVRRKIFPIMPLFIVVYWASWWFGSQQTRFLYIPIILMYIVVVAELKKPSYFLKGAILAALLLTALSVFRAHHNYFGVRPLDVIRKRDLDLVAQSRSYISENKKGFIDLSYGDAAFAQFPVNVKKEVLPFIILH